VGVDDMVLFVAFGPFRQIVRVASMV